MNYFSRGSTNRYLTLDTLLFLSFSVTVRSASLSVLVIRRDSIMYLLNLCTKSSRICKLKPTVRTVRS